MTVVIFNLNVVSQKACDVIIAHKHFRCGKRFDITKVECGNKIFNYNAVSTSDDCNKGDVNNVCSHHETSYTSNTQYTREFKEQYQKSCGNSTFYRGISTKEGEVNIKNDQMNKNEFEIVVPPTQLESLNDTITLSENDGVRKQVESTGLRLCCCCRQREILGPESGIEDRQYSFADRQECNDNTVKGMITASNAVTVIATQYVGNYTQVENQSEKKRSKLHQFLERTQNKKPDNSGRSRYGKQNIVDSGTAENLGDKHHNKKSRKTDILRRFKKRETDKSSFLRPPSVEYGTKQQLGAEASDISNITALSMDSVQYIETEYPEYPELTNFSDDGEVSLTLLIPRAFQTN